jgi:hypothetical protein
MGIVQAIREYGADGTKYEVPPVYPGNRWQYEALADSGLFRPICYQLGKCQFEADFDRHCSIRERVTENFMAGRSSDKWHEPLGVIDPIRPEEWLLDPAAARNTSGGGGHE